MTPLANVPLRNDAASHTNAVRERRVVSDRSLRYLHYVPATAMRRDLVVVAVHGISRNAIEHAQAFRPLADWLGCPLIAPRFERRSFRDYQLLGLEGRGRRADHALQLMLADLCRFGIEADARLVLCGYSGGAQFAHRFALVHGRRIAALLVAAAGWYTWPDAAMPYPRGCATALPGAPTLEPSAMLERPVLVLVGEHDTARDATLRRDAWIDSAQGLTRVDRAHSFVQRLTSEARWRGLSPRCEFGLIPGAGHDFAAMVTGGLVERFAAFLRQQSGLLDDRRPERLQPSAAGTE